MCRNIKILFNFEPPVTEAEIRNASLQFVRKISGFGKPSKANEEAFASAVDEIAEASSRLLHSLKTNAEPRHGEEDSARRETDSARIRFGARQDSHSRVSSNARMSAFADWWPGDSRVRCLEMW